MAEPLVRLDHLWVPSVPNTSSSTSDGMCNTSLTIFLKIPKFLSLNEFHCWTQKTKLKELCQPTLCTPCAFMNKLAYSLFLAFFLVLVNIYFHRDPMVSKWLSNVIWLDERNHTLPCKVLGISFQKKIINSLSPQINENSYQSQS